MSTSYEMSGALWREYDRAAEWCAARNLTGAINTPLPDMTPAVHEEINADPEAFESRVRECAYAQAMERRS